MGFRTLDVKYSEKILAYTGEELRPHFLLEEFGVRGSGIVAFQGPCSVATGALVDWEDRLANDRIEARRMVHFIGEFFGSGLKESVLIQRLLVARATEEARRFLALGPRKGLEISRDGDDIFVAGAGAERRKLSVSIVTASPVSTLLHLGINVDPDGAPVAAIGLAEMGIDPEAWVPALLEGFAEEMASVEWACAKVRPVI